VILIVEGNFAGGYEIGLHWATDLVSRVADGWAQPVELVVAGYVPEAERAHHNAESVGQIHWLDQRPPEAIPSLDRSVHVLFAADLHPACPNAVLEAMACGLPVVSFNTGALPELVQGDSGRIVDYGGDPWQLDPPDIRSLAEATTEILAAQSRFRRAARRRAENTFGLERMVDEYLQVMGWV
jgi:glycosyltransferase involved in cell wall biosynthesis